MQVYLLLLLLSSFTIVINADEYRYSCTIYLKDDGRDREVINDVVYLKDGHRDRDRINDMIMYDNRDDVIHKLINIPTIDPVTREVNQEVINVGISMYLSGRCASYNMPYEDYIDHIKFDKESCALYEDLHSCTIYLKSGSNFVNDVILYDTINEIKYEFINTFTDGSTSIDKEAFSLAMYMYSKGRCMVYNRPYESYMKHIKSLEETIEASYNDYKNYIKSHEEFSKVKQEVIEASDRSIKAIKAFQYDYMLMPNTY